MALQRFFLELRKLRMTMSGSWWGSTTAMMMTMTIWMTGSWWGPGSHSLPQRLTGHNHCTVKIIDIIIVNQDSMTIVIVISICIVL